MGAVELIPPGIREALMPHHLSLAMLLTRTVVLEQREVGSSAGAAPSRKDIERAQRSA